MQWQMPSTQSGMLQVQVGESNSQKKKKKLPINPLC